VDGKGSFSKLQSWYLAQCDGDWEHDERVRINTLDNPGWRLWVNLADTELAGRELQRVQVERSDSDWVNYRADGRVFDAACGPLNLDEVVSVFVSWATANS